MADILLGVVITLTVLVAALGVFPLLAQAGMNAVWRTRDSFGFCWAVFDTFLRQNGLRRGPRLNLTRQARRRIAREMAKRMV